MGGVINREVGKGTTSKLIDVFILDSSKTDGSGLTGLVFNSAGLTAYYYREGAGSAVSITLATMTVGTWATGGFKEIDSVNLPGFYQLGIPDLALATGANAVSIMLKGAANMVSLPIDIQLVGYAPDAGTVVTVTGNVNGSVASVTGSVGSVTGAVGSVTGAVGSVTAGVTVTTNNDKAGYALTAGERTAITTALLATALVELAQAQPSATPALNDALMLLYMGLRNGRTVTATTDSIRNNAGAVVAKAAVSDDGTTFTRAQMVTGP